MSRRWKSIVKVLIALLGAYLIFRLIEATGPAKIASAFREHGWVLILIATVYVIFHLTRTATLRICIPHGTKYWNLFAVRLAGEAISYLAIGSIFGDAMKVVLARENIPVSEGATGVFAEKLIYHLAGACFLIGGLLVAVAKLGMSRALFYFFLFSAGFLLLLLYLLSSGVRPISRILKSVRVRRPQLREAVLRTEASLFQFRKDHPREFLLTLILDLFCYFYSTAEVFFLFHVLGLHPGFLDIWYFEAVVKMSNTATTLVPASMGVFEATHLYLAKQLGLGESNGLIVALFVRIRAILWALIGYLVFLFLLGKGRNGATPIAREDLI